MSEGGLTKVLIEAFTDKKLEVKDSKFPSFTLPINPESYSKNYKVEYDTSQGQGNQGTDPKFKSTAPEELKLDFIFDGTGTVEGYVHSKELVSKQIYTFLNTVYFMEGEIHRPKFLKVHWGMQFTFECVLSNLDINYTLFNPDGEPLRAKISATFLNYIEQEKRAKREDTSSPDLTHVRTVTEGDTLPLMVYKIYGSTGYLLQVAKANGITNFRNLEVGKDIVFPPIHK